MADVKQSSLAVGSQNNANTRFLNTILEGVVVKVHYPYDSKLGTAESSAESMMTYDVQVTSALMPVLFGVPVVSSIGWQDGHIEVLRAASGDVSRSGEERGLLQAGFLTYNSDRPGAVDPLSTDGDRVLVAFVNGNPMAPIIIGRTTVRNNELSKFKSWRLRQGLGRGIRRLLHRGTDCVFDAYGNLSVDFAGHPDTASQIKSLSIRVAGFNFRFSSVDGKGFNFVISATDGSGRVYLNASNTGTILGTTQAEPMVLGQTLTNLLTDVINDLATHTHTGNLGAPTPRTDLGVPALNLISRLPSILSLFNKVSKGTATNP